MTIYDLDGILYMTSLCISSSSCLPSCWCFCLQLTKGVFIRKERVGEVDIQRMTENRERRKLQKPVYLGREKIGKMERI